MWWDARSKTSRQNAYLALVIGALFVAIVAAATARDKSPTSRVISSRPQPTTTLRLPTPSTVNIGDSGSIGGSVTTADPFGQNATSITPAPETTTAPPQATRPAATAATTVAPAPVTTVTNPGVVFGTVPPETTTTTRPPTTTTQPAPTTTVPPTTTTVLSVPLRVPNLLAPVYVP